MVHANDQTFQFKYEFPILAEYRTVNAYSRKICVLAAISNTAQLTVHKLMHETKSCKFPAFSITIGQGPYLRVNLY
uniref:Uncharacterized protein n=1 Tax=Rhizophora mucronata TaxID=61149 RepID=A0A2P2MZT3_RHIMU